MKGALHDDIMIRGPRGLVGYTHSERLTNLQRICTWGPWYLIITGDGKAGAEMGKFDSDYLILT